MRGLMSDGLKLPPAVPAGVGGAVGTLAVLAATGPLLSALVGAAIGGGAVAIVVGAFDAFQNRKPRTRRHGQPVPGL